MAESTNPSRTPFRVLAFSKTAAYRHEESIPAGVGALERLAATTGRFAVTASEDAEAYFTPDGLGAFSVLVFLSTSGNFLTDGQVDALKGFVRAGGGFVGIHCASFGLHDHDWYGELVGARFVEHPVPQVGRILVENREHVVCCAEDWMRGGGGGEGGGEGAEGVEWLDEWYNFQSNPRGKVHVLMTVDEESYNGGTMGQDHPIAWCRDFDGGRSFYTALGHFADGFQDDRFMSQILKAIMWCSGEK